MPQQSYDGIKYSAVAYIYSVMIHVVTMIYCTVVQYPILKYIFTLFTVLYRVHCWYFRILYLSVYTSISIVLLILVYESLPGY